MAEEISTKIFNAIKEIQGTNDPEVFVKQLLKDTLNWPIELTNLDDDYDDILYVIIQNSRKLECVVMKEFEISFKIQHSPDGPLLCLL